MSGGVRRLAQGAGLANITVQRYSLVFRRSTNGNRASKVDPLLRGIFSARAGESVRDQGGEAGNGAEPRNLSGCEREVD